MAHVLCAKKKKHLISFACSAVFRDVMSCPSTRRTIGRDDCVIEFEADDSWIPSHVGYHSQSFHMSQPFILSFLRCSLVRFPLLDNVKISEIVHQYSALSSGNSPKGSSHADRLHRSNGFVAKRYRGMSEVSSEHQPALG